MKDERRCALKEPPLVTFALIAFNQREFIAEAVRAALAQDYSPIQLVLSDDCSTDDTFEIMSALVRDYRGPHEVVLNRNAVNLGSRGIGLHVNKIIELSRGLLIVLGAGDDVSLPDRVSVLTNRWVAAGAPDGSIHSAATSISGSGASSGIFHGDAKFGQRSVSESVRIGCVGVLGATHAITRSVFDRFGGLPEGTLFEDRTLAFRSLLMGTVLYCPEALVKYRQHDENLSGGQNYSDAARWSRWIEGTVTKYETFLADYKIFLRGRAPDPKVLRAIRRGLARAKRSRQLVVGSPFARAFSALNYSKGFRMSDRVAFVLQSAGAGSSFIYRSMAVIWKASRRLFR
ncbi:MAG: glycosyltransferase [Pseudomonadota bacterium]